MLVAQLHTWASLMHSVDSAEGMQQLVSVFRKYTQCIDAVRHHDCIPQLDTVSSCNEISMEEEVLDDEVTIVHSQTPIQYGKLQDQQARYQKLYADAMTRLLEFYCRESQVDCKDFLIKYLQATYEHEELDQHTLFIAAEWERKRCDLVRNIIEICWAPAGVRPVFGNGTFFPRPNIAPSTEQIVKNSDLMLKCVFSIQGRWAPLFQQICAVILPSFISKIPLKMRYMKVDDVPFLHYLEKRLLHHIDTNNTVIRLLLTTLVKAKIEVREHLIGYSVCLRELLNEYPALKQEFFQLFLLVVHAPLPENDTRFCEEFLERSEEAKSYQQHILKHDMLTAEQYLLQEVCKEEVAGKRKHSEVCAT